jgi:hypothetical protein
LSSGLGVSFVLVGTTFSGTGSEESLVFRSLGLGASGTGLLGGDFSALALETLGSNKTLDLRSLGVGLLVGILGLDFTTDDVLTDIVFLG